MKVLFATSEIAPWVKTGGLGDVAAALPPALRALGMDVRVLVPRYPALVEAFPETKAVARLEQAGGLLPHATILEAHAADGTPLWLIDYPPYYGRDGNPYLGPEGRDWLDNHMRFGLLSRVAAWLGSDASTAAWRPDIIHCNDWQTGMAPAYLRYLPGGRAKSVITVHNLAFQGMFGRAALYELGLNDDAWHIDGVEYYGHMSFLKGGLRHADWITTVSPTYAAEIQTEAEGMGLDGLLRTRGDRLSGIINGIDLTAWNPASDPHLASDYDAAHLGRKALNKAALQAELGLEPRADLPLLGIVSRLTEQKGLDLIPPIAEALLALPAQFAVLGSGAKELEAAFAILAARHPGRFAVRIGFNEPLAHRIEAGADLFLMPSRFEPCGLNQMYSLRYGTPPVVRATGGLADTVIDADADKQGNGFVFTEATAAELLAAVERGIAAWRKPARWSRIQKSGMARDLGWGGPARQYVEIYQRVLAAAPLAKPDLASSRPAVTLIAAIARNGVIGSDNALPWRLPEDMAHFKALTTGHAVIMGRKTWESLPPKFRPLPGRHNIVVTRDPRYHAKGASVAHSLDEAVTVAASGDATPFIIGGAELYRQALPLAGRLELTEIAADFAGDAHFPEFGRAAWREVARTTGHAAAGFDYAFVSYERR